VWLRWVLCVVWGGFRLETCKAKEIYLKFVGLGFRVLVGDLQGKRASATS
jgi:hypothetical protein